MSNEHFVPQLLLRRFTSDGKKSTPIWEYSVPLGTFRRRCVRSVCSVENLHALSSEAVARGRATRSDVDAGALERDIGRRIEDPFAKSLERIEADSLAISDEDVDSLGSYVAFQLVRTPFAMGRHVAEAEGDITHDEVLGKMLLEQHEVFELVKEREWSLWRTTPHAGHLILADNPVCLMTQDRENLALTPDGLSRRDGVLTMPLSRSLFVRAEYGGPGGRTLPADREIVAWANYVSIRRAVYSAFMPEPQFEVWHGVGTRCVTRDSPLRWS
jgi:hypothetical protein